MKNEINHNLLIENELKIFELHLRQGGSNYAGSGYFHLIGRNGNTPSWEGLQSFIKYLFPFVNLVNPIHPFYLNLYGKPFEAYSAITFDQLIEDLCLEDKNNIISKLMNPDEIYYLIYEGISIDENTGNLYKNKNNKIIVLHDYSEELIKEI
jgi:hypothetical protein